MTTYRGNSGRLKVGASPTVVAELTEYSVQTTIGILDDTAMGDTARTHKHDALPDFSGSGRGWYDPTDTNGQAVLIEGAELAMECNPVGSANGQQKLTGNIIITGITISPANGQIVPFEFNFQGTGGLTRGVIS